tara:strand:- start:252 stop:473 length:222 start_codon:yes stop_codon:yes gene_type:complete
MEVTLIRASPFASNVTTPFVDRTFPALSQTPYPTSVPLARLVDVILNWAVPPSWQNKMFPSLSQQADFSVNSK